MSQQMRDFAVERGRVDEAGNPDLSGFTVDHAPISDHHGEEPYPHYTYVVNQRVAITEERKQVKINERDWAPPKQAKAIMIGDFGRRKVDVQAVDKKVSVIDLDVKDHNGNIVARIPFASLSDFFAFVNSHEPKEDRDRRKKDGAKHGSPEPHYLVTKKGNKTVPRDPLDVSSFRWSEEREEPVGELSPDDRASFEIDLMGGSNNTLDRIFGSRQELENVPGQSLIGLSIMRTDFIEPVPDTFQRVVRKLQVTGDILVHGGNPRGGRFERLFEITEFDEQDRPVAGTRRLFTNEDLKALLDDKKKGAWKDLTDVKRHDLAHKEVDELMDSGEWDHVRNTSIYADAHWEVPKLTLQEARRAAGRLRRAAEQEGGTPMETVEALRGELASRYHFATEMLKIRPSIDEYHNPGQDFMIHLLNDEATLRSLLDGSTRAPMQQRQHLAFAVGLGFLKQLMPEPRIARGESVPTIEDDGELKVTTKGRRVFSPNMGSLEPVQDFVKAEVRAIIGKIGNAKNRALEEDDNAEALIDQDDVVRVGDLLLRELGE